MYEKVVLFLVYIIKRLQVRKFRILCRLFFFVQMERLRQLDFIFFVRWWLSRVMLVLREEQVIICLLLTALRMFQVAYVFSIGFEVLDFKRLILGVNRSILFGGGLSIQQIFKFNNNFDCVIIILKLFGVCINLIVVFF